MAATGIFYYYWNCDVDYTFGSCVFRETLADFW